MSNNDLQKGGAPQTLQEKDLPSLQPQSAAQLPPSGGGEGPQARRDCQHPRQAKGTCLGSAGPGRSLPTPDGPDVHTRIQRLKENIPLRYLIGQDVELRAGLGLCPLHEDHDPSLVVWDNRWSCYGCGKGGDHLDWLRLFHGLSFRQAMEKLEALAAQPSPLRPTSSDSRSKATKTPTAVVLDIARMVIATKHPNTAMAARIELYFAINPEI